MLRDPAALEALRAVAELLARVQLPTSTASAVGLRLGSADARALTAEPLAPGTGETFAEVRDPEHRLLATQVPLDDAVCSRPSLGAVLDEIVGFAPMDGPSRLTTAAPIV